MDFLFWPPSLFHAVYRWTLVRNIGPSNRIGWEGGRYREGVDGIRRGRRRDEKMVRRGEKDEGKGEEAGRKR
jgi:hypothetical protein